MSKIALIAFARTASSRCPNKVLFNLGGKPAFMHIIERITSVVELDYTLVACHEDARDDPVELFAKQYGIDCFRGGENARRRVVAAGRSLKLKDDDMVLVAGCDNPLGVYRHIPYLLEQMDKYDCEYALADVPKDTLIWSLYPVSETRSYGLQVQFDQGIYTVEGQAFQPNPFFEGCRRLIRLKFPPEYLIPWPWGRLSLDWPSHACVIKEIYRQLYKGFPIDAFDVYNLLKQQPRLANTIPPIEGPEHLKKGDTAGATRTSREMFFKGFKLLGGEVIELTWKGGSNNKEIKRGRNPKTNRQT